MIESFMLIALGFLTATLFALIAIQLAWRRAVTLTTRKLTSEFDLDDLKLKAERASLLDVTLREKQDDIDKLTARNGLLEETISTARADAGQLQSDIADLQAQHTQAQNEANTYLQELNALQARFNELEAAAHHEIGKRGQVENQLKSLGETASRLIADMSSVATQIGVTQEILSAEAPRAAHDVEAETPPQAEPTPPTTPLLKPFPEDDEDPLIDDNLAGDMTKLAEIKAALGDSDAAPESGEAGPMEDEATEPAASEGFFADRIRALKEGVRAQA
jgi:DNA repair exonuclease SbcCD ATPase subunit